MNRLTTLVISAAVAAVFCQGSGPFQRQIAIADAAPAHTADCAAVTLTLHPGLHPAGSNGLGERTARNIPRQRFTVSLPVYPGATRLQTYVGEAFFGIPADPYLQTASAQWSTAGSTSDAQTAIGKSLQQCGWKSDGSWGTNSGVFTSGIDYVSVSNPNLTVEVGVGSNANGNYIDYGVEEITLPMRPASSYLHGPFDQVRIALRREIVANGQPTSKWQVVDAVITDRPSIERMVSEINNISGHRTATAICMGALDTTGPAWLTFVRPNGSRVHAFERGPGACGGLAVNGTRWMTDPGAIWTQLLSSTKG